jgi:MYXO-CTERM domain-containing protein
VLAGLLVTGVAGGARAYVRELSNDGAPIMWVGTNCIPLTVYPKGFTQMPADEVAGAAMAAASAWTQPPSPDACSYMTLTMSASMDDPPVAVPVAQASIVFREANWCFIEADGSCSTDPMMNSGYGEETLMLTSDAVNKKTGQIYMGATEVNAKYFQWADLVAHPEMLAANSRLQDLQNALTHELGHFIGLGHTCTLGGEVEGPDDQGNPVPPCTEATDAIRATTMAPSAAPGDVQKRTLEPDDVHGICGIYPLASDPHPGMCVTPADVAAMTGSSGCSCATAPASDPGAPAATGGALLALSAIVAARRRRATRSP